MISRREMVTAGVLGTMASSAAPADAAQSQDDQQTASALRNLGNKLDLMNETLMFGQKGPQLVTGFMADIRERMQTHLRSAGKFPEFIEVGCTVFFDVYDWHIRYGQPVNITRISEQRFAIQWMFTQLIVRWEQDVKYIGTPFDRG